MHKKSIDRREWGLVRKDYSYLALVILLAISGAVLLAVSILKESSAMMGFGFLLLVTSAFYYFHVMRILRTIVPNKKSCH